MGALFSNITGGANMAIGNLALFNADGNDNTASGFKALFENISGNRNTAVGSQALAGSSGSKNIALGFKAGATLVHGNNNIYIDHVGNGDESETIRIGTAQAQTFIAGIGNAGVSGATVEVDTATGQLGIAPSSARYKQDIAAMGVESEGILKLRPVTFAYKADAQHVKHYGLVAEEVEKVYPELVTRTASGEVQTVKYHELIPMLLNELQHEHQAFQDEHQALEQQRAELTMLRQALRELRALVGIAAGK
jgi:hypothetical protein